MPKVYIRRKINEEISITDSTLAQQYLAVKKQIADKQTKKDQQMKVVNQIDNEINILQKNLIAIETKAATSQGKTTTEKPAENTTQPQQQATTTTQPAQTQATATTESLASNILRPKSKEELPSLDDYREMVISFIDKNYHDGESLAYTHDDDIQEAFEMKESPEDIARQIVDMDKWGKTFESQYVKGMDLLVNGKSMYIDKVEKYPRFDVLHVTDHNYNSQMINSNWLDQQKVSVLSGGKKEKSKLSKSQKKKIADRYWEIESELRNAKEDLKDAKLRRQQMDFDMEQDMAGYDEMKQPKSVGPLKAKPKHDIWGDQLNQIEEEIEELSKKVQDLQNEYDDIDNKILDNGINVFMVYESNESIYDEMVDNIQQELIKLADIKSFIEDYDDQPQETPVLPAIPVEVNPRGDWEEKFSNAIGDDFSPEEDEMDWDNVTDEIVKDRNPLYPSEEEKIVDETLKVEDGKAPYVPLLEDEEDEEDEEDDDELESEMLNYEEDDEDSDEYVFHVRINGDEEDEIIAKIYRNSDDDGWIVRVVKGDEEPLQSMEFDDRLDKLGIIGYLADMFDDIEIIDPKEYEYLLDDKDKLDSEYYKNDE